MHKRRDAVNFGLVVVQKGDCSIFKEAMKVMFVRLLVERLTLNPKPLGVKLDLVVLQGFLGDQKFEKHCLVLLVEGQRHLAKLLCKVLFHFQPQLVLPPVVLLLLVHVHERLANVLPEPSQ